jgi:hypothetical protein
VYNPSLLTDIALKNGAKIKRSADEIGDAVLASPQAKVAEFDEPDYIHFEVEEGSDDINVTFGARVSAPVSVYLSDTPLPDEESWVRLMCEAAWDTTSMRIKEGSLHIDDDKFNSNEAVAANSERLTKEIERQAQEEIVFDRYQVAERLSGSLPRGEIVSLSYPYDDSGEPGGGYFMDYLHGVRLGLVERPEPWVQALVDDLRTQCRALFDGEETYCDPTNSEAGDGSFPNDLYPIRIRIHNILRAGIRGDGEWAAYAPLIRAVTPETVRKLYRLPEELPLLKVDELPVSAEDTKTLGELLSAMELIGVSTPDQGKLVEHYQRLRKLHEGFTHYADLWERLAGGDAGEDVVTRIADYNEQVSSVEDCSNAIADALRAVEHTLKVNGVIRYLYQAQENRGKVKPLQDLDCLALGAYVQDSPDVDQLEARYDGVTLMEKIQQGDKPLQELNSFFFYECEFAQKEEEKGNVARVYSDNADFLAHYFPFPSIACIRAAQPPHYWGGNMSNTKLAALTISVLTHSRKPWAKEPHRALMEAFVAAGAYDMAYADAHSDRSSLASDDLSAIEPHCRVMDPLLEASKTLYEDLHRTYLLPHRDEDTVFEVAQLFVDDINSILPMLDDLHGLNRQWLAVKNYLFSSGSSLDEDYQQDQEQRVPIVELLMEKLSLTDTDLERVGLSRQLLLGEGKPLSRFLVENRLLNERRFSGDNEPHGYYQFILPDDWSFILGKPDRRDIDRTLYKVEVPMSQLGKQCGGMQEAVVAELIRAFHYSGSSRRDVVFTKEESEKILDYVQTGDVDASRAVLASVHDPESYWDTFKAVADKVWKPSPIAKVADQEAFNRGSNMRLDYDCHIILNRMIAFDVDDTKAADERARLAREIRSRWTPNAYYHNCVDRNNLVIAVGGTSKGDTSVWNGEVIPHFRGTIGDFLNADEQGYVKISTREGAAFCGGDPRTQCTYWQLNGRFQYEFVRSYMR